MADIPIMEIAVLLAASRNRAYRQSVLDSFRVMVEFLQANGLVARELIPSGEIPGETFELWEGDLTPEGVLLVDKVVPRWFNWIEKGNPINDVSILERGLAKIRKNNV
jgi:hypothetical protein